MEKRQKSQTKTTKQSASRLGVLLRSFWRKLENTAFVLVVLLVTIYFLLQMPAIQNWLVNKVSTFLSAEWQTKIEVQRVDIEFFDNVILEGFFIEDNKGDTLLYAGQLEAGMKTNFFAFLGDKFEFNDIGISNARFNIRREEGDTSNSLNEFIAKISKPKGNKKKSSSIVINVKNLHLHDVRIEQDLISPNKRNSKIVDREYQLFNIPYAQIRVNAIDTDKNLIDIQSAHIAGLSVKLANSEQPATMTAAPVAKPSAKPGKVPKQPMLIRVASLLVTDGQFKMDQFDASPVRSSLPNVMDYEHLNIQDIVLEGENLELNDAFNSNDFRLKGKITHLTAREQCGFILTHAGIEDLTLSDSLASMINVKITTPGSSIGDSIQFHYSGYRDLRSFEDSVVMDIRLAKDARLRIGDLNFFDKNIAQNELFIINANNVANVRGYVHGTVNRLRADDMVIRLDDSTYVACDFRGNNLSKRDEPQTLTFDFKELRSDLNSLRRILPGFNPPEQFLKLGSIVFKGEYQLFDGVDHILYGDIVSDLGSGATDLHLNLKDGREKAVYSGGLEMRSFDMASWTGNKEFGRTTFHVNIAENSTGLTLNTIKAKISGEIDTLSYKGYRYRHIYLNGAFREKIFEGALISDDPNVDFTFDGTINLKEALPRFEFSANIKRLDLGVLNLTQKDIVLSTKVQKLSLVGNTLEDITGEALFQDFKVLQDREDWHIIDSLRFFSNVRADGSRHFGFNSNIAKGELSGSFNLNNILQHLAYLLQRYHPSFAEHLHIAVEEPLLAPTDNYDLTLQVHDSKNLTKLLSADLDTLRDVHITAHVNAIKGISKLVFEAPSIKYDGINFLDPGFTWESNADSGNFHLKLPVIMLSPKRQLPPISFSGSLISDALFFTIEAAESNSLYLENLFLKGKLSTFDSLWQVQFNASKIKLFSQEWLIADDNFIRFGHQYIDTKKFEFFNGNQRILLEDQNNGRGLKFSLTNFNLSELNRLFDPEQLSISGNLFDFDIGIRDIFLMQGLDVGILSDTVIINSQPYGILLSNLGMEDLSSPLYYKVFLQNGNNQRLRIAGAWLPIGNQSFFSKAFGEELSVGELFASATIQDFPFAILETFIPDISKTAGSIDANLLISGSPDRVGVTGPINIRSGQFQIDYLKSMFYLKDQIVNISKNKIEVVQDTIWDASQQHLAIVRGELEHDNFKKWRVNCNVKSTDRSFMMLNTSIQDNELFYGQGIGSFNLSITGSFVRTNMTVDATTGKDTRLYIPLSTTSDAKEVSFIRFTNTNTEKNDAEKLKSFSFTDLKGLNFEMNLTVTEEAEIQLIFDEQAGDIIKSRGEGDIKLSINREGDFKMYGGYRVTKGEYLFTLLNFVNKPFTMVSGGTINWFGDPYGAELNLDATYELNTAVYNFVRDEVELLTSLKNDATKNEATKATRVVVTMHINGDLLKPDITFGMEFPNVTSQLKSMTDNKLRLIRQDQNEMSRQIFGLIVIGSFLPENSGAQASDYVSSAFNTLTQMISNQFSSYLGGLAAEWFNKDISSVDLDIIYSDYQNVLADPNQALTGGGRELQVRLKSGFIDDKITVQVGSQFGLGGRTNLPINNGFLGEDVTIEIRLTENNQWRLKVYQRTEPDISGQRRDRYGVGLSFQKEYDSISDVWAGLGNWRRKGK